jgi:predicted nucleotidyltransferase
MERALSAERLDALRRLLEQDPDVEVAVVFGSAAARRLSWDSDVDLYLRLAGGARWTIEHQWQRRRLFADTVGRDVELVIEDRDATSVILRREVARKGRLLFEAAPGAWTRLRAESMIAYADLEPWLRRCGDGVRRAVRRRASLG